MSATCSSAWGIEPVRGFGELSLGGASRAETAIQGNRVNGAILEAARERPPRHGEVGGRRPPGGVREAPKSSIPPRVQR